MWTTLPTCLSAYRAAQSSHDHKPVNTCTANSVVKLIVSIICTQLNLGHLAPCSWEPVVINLNCLLLNMNSTNKMLLFDRFLIMYNLCVFTCIIFIFVFHCTHVLHSYLLTYLLTCGQCSVVLKQWNINMLFTSVFREPVNPSHSKL